MSIAIRKIENYSLHNYYFEHDYWLFLTQFNSTYKKILFPVQLLLFTPLNFTFCAASNYTGTLRN